MNIEFQNLTGTVIWLPSKEGGKIYLAKFERRILDEWYRKYSPRYLREIRQVTEGAKSTGVKAQVIARQSTLIKQSNTQNIGVQAQRRREIISKNPIVRINKTREIPTKHPTKHVLGRSIKTIEKLNIQNSLIPISNNIGIGILSYNRLNCIKRVIESISKHTDLSKTTVFVSDESDDKSVIDYLNTVENIVVIHDERIGVAGNTNRLLNCLERFKYKIILNDDVEVLQDNWEYYLTESLENSGLHHFNSNQGVYDKKQSDQTINIDGVELSLTLNKPEGSILVFDDVAFKSVGFFDEEFGLYGMEHVDWANRVSLSGIQRPGFYSLINAKDYIKTHNEKSSTKDRSLHLKKSKNLYERVRSDEKRIFINSSTKSNVDAISCVIPFRGVDRNDSIKTVIRNLKASKFPKVDIYVIEQNNKPELDLTSECVNYFVAKTDVDTEFNKSLAFNFGVSKSRNDKVILHDADMMVQADYIKTMFNLLNIYEGVHIGKNVVYLNEESTNILNKTNEFNDGMVSDRNVIYYEGGSLGCLKSTYVEIGGFFEEFIGYGCEDCEFFGRLKSKNFYNERSINLIHLWHGRVNGWQSCHSKNKELESKLSGMNLNDRIKKTHEAFIGKYK